MEFVARSKELATLAEAGAPLVVLWGAGGAGKTRLAAEHAAREHAAGRDVVWIDLASARTRDEAAAAIASAMGIAAEDDSLARACAARRALVVADNVEQLDAEARALVASLASRGGSRVLATSREALWEDALSIPIGPLPDEDAVALFEAASDAPCDRATALAIVRRLDGLPLALELAGARASLLGGSELLARLDRKLDLMGKLREAIAWSWELLDARDREALVACASFETPFDAPLAEAVIGEGAIDRLERLERRALLHVERRRQGRPALRLLEAVRDFAREQPSFAATLARHAAAVLARVEPEAEALRRGADANAELRARREDLAAIAARVPELAARATLALASSLAVTGPAPEIAMCVTAALAEGQGSVLRARRGDSEADLLVARAGAHMALGRTGEAARDLERAIPLAERRGDGSPLAADARRLLGATLRAEGRAEDALAELDRALTRARALGDRAREGITIDEIGAALQGAGRLGPARERHAEAIAILASEGSRRAEGTARSRLAVATHRAGDPAGAVRLHEEALAIHRATGHARLEGAELLHLGFVRHELAMPAQAREALAAARARLAAAGARGLEAYALVLCARLDVDEGDANAALLGLAEAAQLAPASWARLTATRLLVQGHLAMARGDAPAAAEAYRASLGASRAVEVGFEALTPAYLALATRDARLLDDARALLGSHENPHLRAALAILTSAVADQPPPAPDPRALGASSEVRRTLAFVGARRGLRLEQQGRLLVLTDGRSVDLSRRKNVRSVLARLARERRDRPGRPVCPEELLAAGWPGERMRAAAATKRLHTAIWTLRSLGLADVLRTEGDGYLLDPMVGVEISE